MYLKRNNPMEILSLYTSGYTKQFYLREISKLTKIPLKTVQNTLKELEQAKIIKSAIRGKNKYFTLNLGNIQTKLHLIESELYKTSLFLERYTPFKTFLKSIESSIPIIVFGGFAKFSADQNSDVDLLVISPKELKLPSHLLPNKIHQICMPEKAFSESLKKQEPLTREIEESHIILNNHSFYVNSVWGYYGSK